MSEPRWLCIQCRGPMTALEIGRSTVRGWGGVARIVAMYQLRCGACGAARTAKLAVGYARPGKADTAEEHGQPKETGQCCDS